MNDAGDGEDLRRAAWRALARPQGQGEQGRVERAVFDVTIDGRTEMVTVVAREGTVQCSSTDGRAQGPHVQAVLRLLAASVRESERPAGVSEREARAQTSAKPPVGAGAESPVEGRAEEPGEAPAGHVERSLEQARVSPRITHTGNHGGRTTLPPGATRTLGGTDQPESANRAALAAALDDVLTAVVRVGVRRADRSPSVDDAVERLVRAAPSPMPLGIGRWIGRLRWAMASRDVDTLARILDGAARVAEDMRKTTPPEEGLARIVSWLGATGDTDEDIEPLYDRELIEIGREWLQGVERAGIERRYLMDSSSGEVYREERARGGGFGSVGPCPRVITVGFAEVERGAHPRRIRLLQYALSLDVSVDDWSRVSASALRTFRPLASGYRRALEGFPGLAEPFTLIAPSRYDDGEGLVPIDGEGDPLPVARADDPEGADVLERLAEDDPPEWIAGRLVDAHGRLMIVPCSAATMEADGRMRLHRVR